MRTSISSSSSPLRRLRWALGICAVLLALFAQRHALADDLADEADLQFQLGAERYEANDFKTALEHFLASNRLVPNKNVLFNIARTYEQLKQAPDAYRYYLQALDGETNPAARKKSEDALARISPLVAVLKVETDPPGATVFLDRKDLGSRGNTPRTLGLAAGRHKVIVELAGYEPAESESLDLKIGQESKVSLKLVAILGGVKIDGIPGATIRVDREEGPIVGTVPTTLQLTPGRHVLFFYKEGYQVADLPVDVPARQTISVRARLQEQTGALVVNSDVRDALIQIDDRPSGFTPAVLQVPVGRHRVRVSQSGFRTYEGTVEVRVGEEARLDLQLTTLEEVTAASRVTESVEDAPSSVTIITRQELRAMGYPTIAEAVRGVRGLYLSDDRSYVTIGVRGFSRPGDYGNRILVLFDGHPANDNYIWSSYVGFDGRVDIDDVERIEVVRGPGSVLYGSSAFFGVINVVTRDRSLPTHREVGFSTAEYGVGRARVMGFYRMKDVDAGMWLSVAGAHASGRDFFFPEAVANPQDPNAERGANGLPVDGNARGVDGFDAGMVTGRAWYKAFTVQWFLNSRKKTLPTGEYGTLFGDPRNHFADTRGFVEARFEPQVSEQVQLLSRAHVNMYDFDGASAYAPPDGVSHDTFRGRWFGLEQRVAYKPTDLLKLTVGAEVVRHTTTRQIGENDIGPYLFDNNGNPARNDPFSVLAGYANGDITPSKILKLSVGARLDYYSSLDSFDALAAFSPRAAVIVKPYDRGNLKILAGKAFRAPSVYELYYTSTTQVRPSGLQPEQIYSGEVEFSHRFSNTVIGQVAAYANYVKDLVELRDIPDPSTPGNTLNQYANSNAPVLVLGSEYELRREWRQGWMLGASYTLQKAQYLNDASLRDVPNSPVHLASVKGAIPLIGRTLMGMTRVSLEGPRPDRSFRAADPPQQDTDVGVIWDLVLSGEVDALGVRYAIGAYNVADWKYDTVPSGEFRQRTVVQNGRTFMASVTARF